VSDLMSPTSSKKFPILNTLDVKPVVLDVQNLRTEFTTEDGIVKAVNGISYTVKEGEVLGIVGESGCGKSVSVLSIMRLLQQPPASIMADSIQFYDTNLLDISDSEIRRIRGSQMSMIFQDPMTSLNPVLTIGFQLKEPLMLHLKMSEKQAEDRSVELLNMVGISEARPRLNSYPHQFSGGMRQRVMIALALACNPSLLIADEPTTALDVTIQAQILELVKKLRDQLGMALIWITHDLAVVAGLADRVAVMYAGYIVEQASVFDLYKSPKHPYTWSLLRAIPRMDGKPGEALASIEGLPPDLLHLPPGCPFAPRCSFSRETCVTANPALVTVAKDHQAACWVDIDTGEMR
jgi:oligopeptide transport system ATP-binding protein